MYMFFLMGVFLHSMHLFKVELEPRYLNSAPGTPAASEPFLPSIVLSHDMAHLNPHGHVHAIYPDLELVLSPGDSCLRFIKTAVRLPCTHTAKAFMLFRHRPCPLS